VETACYYLFSTVSQTLASAFGFLVAVALYRIQAIEGDLAKRFAERDSFWRVKIEQDAYSRAKRRRDWPVVADALENASEVPYLEASPATAREHERKLKVELVDDLKELVAIKATLRQSLMLTAGTIVVSMFLIASTPKFSCITWLAVPALALAIAASIGCLWMYSRLVIGVTK
jgi:hypothetical protein